MGRRVGEVVSQRLGRSLLELGGNNGIVVTAGEMIIDDNSIARNGASGIALLGGVQDVANNTTVFNSEWGIFVGAATVTGGGNLAVFNGTGNCNQPGLCFP